MSQLNLSQNWPLGIFGWTGRLLSPWGLLTRADWHMNKRAYKEEIPLCWEGEEIQITRGGYLLSTIHCAGNLGNIKKWNGHECEQHVQMTETSESKILYKKDLWSANKSGMSETFQSPILFWLFWLLRKQRADTWKAYQSIDFFSKGTTFIWQPGLNGWGPAGPRAQWKNLGHQKVRGDGSGIGK